MSGRATVLLVEREPEGVHVYQDACDPDDRVWLEIDGSAIEVTTRATAPGGCVTVAISPELWAALLEAVRR